MACKCCNGAPPSSVICPDCGTCGAPTWDHYIDLWRRILPGSYTAPIEHEGDGRGFDIPAAQASIFQCMSSAVETSQQAYFLRRFSGATRAWSQGGKKASGSVEVYRSAPVLGDIMLRTGVALLAYVTNSYGARMPVGRFFVTEDTLLAEGNSGPILLPVEAQYEGYAGNVPAGAISLFELLGRKTINTTITGLGSAEQAPETNDATDEFNAELIGRYFRFTSGLVSENATIPRVILAFSDDGSIFFDPPLDNPADIGASTVVEIEEFEDFGITIVAPEICNGRSASLDAIGADRNRGRQPSESDESYRARLGSIGDTISPNALIRTLDCILGPCGIPFEFIETRDIEGLMGFTLDLHPLDFGQVGPIDKVAGSELVGQGIVLMSESTYTRFFIVLVGCPEPGEPYGISALDGPFPNAIDGPQPLDGGVTDSTSSYNDCIAKAWQAVNSARAAGVGFVIMQDCNL